MLRLSQGFSFFLFYLFRVNLTEMEMEDTTIPLSSYEEELVDIDILTPENIQTRDIDDDTMFEPRTNPPMVGPSKETREKREPSQSGSTETIKKSAPFDKLVMNDSTEISKSKNAVRR